MDYRIQDVKEPVEGRVTASHGGGDHTVTINGAEHSLHVIAMTPRGIEFMLDQKYHAARYIRVSTNEMSLVVDNVPVTLNMHAHLDEVVYKNSGGAGAGGAGGAGAQSGLKSQIPGKVVSVDVSEGDSVKAGDVVCTLESMKMQVAVKAHRDGVVRSLRIKKDATVAKGDVIADIE